MLNSLGLPCIGSQGSVGLLKGPQSPQTLKVVGFKGCVLFGALGRTRSKAGQVTCFCTFDLTHPKPLNSIMPHCPPYLDLLYSREFGALTVEEQNKSLQTELKYLTSNFCIDYRSVTER